MRPENWPEITQKIARDIRSDVGFQGLDDEGFNVEGAVDAAIERGADAMHGADIEWLKEHSSRLKYDPTAIVIDIEDWGKFIGDE